MITASHKVQVPVAESVRGFFGLLPRPDFSQLANPAVASAALAIALVGSLQALLTIEAVDSARPRATEHAAKPRIAGPGRWQHRLGLGWWPAADL